MWRCELMQRTSAVDPRPPRHRTSPGLPTFLAQAPVLRRPGADVDGLRRWVDDGIAPLHGSHPERQIDFFALATPTAVRCCSASATARCWSTSSAAWT